MDDLVAWLSAALDEYERVAKAANANSPSPWQGDDVLEDSNGGTIASMTHCWGGSTLDPVDVAHVIRWDPARVLAEVEAKRRILDLWDNAMEPYGAGTAQEAIEALAQPYADRPGFKDEWRLT